MYLHSAFIIKQTKRIKIEVRAGATDCEGRRPRLFADRCVPSARHGAWVGEASESAQQDTFERQATHTQRRKARKADVHELEN